MKTTNGIDLLLTHDSILAVTQRFRQWAIGGAPRVLLPLLNEGVEARCRFREALGVGVVQIRRPARLKPVLETV